IPRNSSRRAGSAAMRSATWSHAPRPAIRTRRQQCRRYPDRLRSRIRFAVGGPTASISSNHGDCGRRTSLAPTSTRGLSTLGWGNRASMSSGLPASERTAVVTGASSGIGCHTALGLARTGMRVVMVGRDRDRTETARQFVIETSGSGNVGIALADFSSLDQVRRLAAKILSANDRLDLLVNNAGLMSPKYRFSFDGFELTFAVNHLAPFLLTNLLLKRLKASSPARIVTVASAAHH